MRLALALLAIPALAHAEPHGAALGAEVGDPAGITGAWFAHAIDVALSVGSGTLAGPGFQTHLDVQMVVLHLAPDIPLRVGLGGRLYNQHYTPQSHDEIPDWHLGARASAALAYEHGAMQLYAELAPGVDLWRSPSCSLVDGAMSVCPRAMSSPVFVDFVVGARWFLSH